VSANISIELKVGASKILLEQSGITIEAPTITIKSLRQGNADKHQLRSDEPSMSQVRFATVRDLFNSFPSAVADVGAADEDLNSLDFLRRLVALMGARHFILCLSAATPGGSCLGEPVDTLDAICATAGRRQDARVCRGLGRGSGRAASPQGTVRRHGGRRQIARDVGCAGRWLVPEELGHVPASPEQTAKAVRVALFIALSRLEAKEKQ
jgi:hypothetical protein